jgi:hypothetical protein
MRYSSIVLLCFFLLNSCKHNEGATATQLFFLNSTKRKIILNFESNISGSNTNIFNLDLNEKKMIYESYIEGGKGTDGDLPFSTNSPRDSAIVIYDDGKKGVYYNKATIISNNLAIKFEDSRNFLNPLNWDKKIISETKNLVKIEYQFAITQEDYLRVK